MPPNRTNNFFGVKVSKAGIPVNQASDKQLIYKDDFSTKTYFDQTNSRMIEGLLPDGTYGLWVSSPGVDVATADPDVPGQLIFNSNQNVLKITLSGSTSITTAIAAPTTVTVPHNLGYAPLAQVYLVIPSFIIPSPTITTLPWANGANDPLIQWYVDAQNLYIFSTSDSGGPNTFTVQYLFVQQSILLT